MAKDKKEKKEKLSSSGISKKEHKKEKKDKKDKLVKKLIDPITGNVSDKLLSEIEKQQVGSAASVVDGEKVVKKDKKEKKDKKKDKEKDKEREKGKAKGNEKEKEGGDGQMDVDTEKTSIVELVVGNREVVDKVKVQQVKVVEGGDILVPFAVPLADEKVTKKALKTIKKGIHSMGKISVPQLHSLIPPSPHFPPPQQELNQKSSSAGSKKSLNLSGNLHLPLHFPLHMASSCSQQISPPWM